MRITEQMLSKLKSLGLPEGKPEENKYLLLKLQGDGRRADPKFNIKVYQGQEGLKLVTNDEHTLRCLLDGKPNYPPIVSRTISIDDSGVGFVLGGVICGMHDSLSDEVVTTEVDVRYFQGDNRLKKKYLEAYALAALSMVNSLHPDKSNTLIRICTGDVNVKAKDALRKQGFFVEVGEIKGKLQDVLEARHKAYVFQKFGYDGYLDPKEHTSRELMIEFNRLRRFVAGRNLWNSCKDNWGFSRIPSQKKGALSGGEKQVPVPFKYRKRVSQA